MVIKMYKSNVIIGSNFAFGANVTVLNLALKKIQTQRLMRHSLNRETTGHVN